MAAKPPRPTGAELNILRTLWEHGAQSVRGVHEILCASRPAGYTTVLKLLQIMTEKGLVNRDDSRRPQIYTARYSRAKPSGSFCGTCSAAPSAGR
jgi:predicted transcriptional regulator